MMAGFAIEGNVIPGGWIIIVRICLKAFRFCYATPE
jgi:hypothetical protein